MNFVQHKAFGPLLLAAIAFIVYANSLGGQFVFDDRAVVFNNPQLLNLKTFGEIFKFNDWRQPLYVTYGFNFYLGQLNPYGYHVLNVALHALNSIVLFYLLLEFGAVRWAALAGAAVFTVHPLFSSSVSYLAGRSSMLCGTFYFLAILFFLKGVQPAAALRRAVWFCVALLAAWLAWSTKQEAITLPLFLAAYMWIRSGAKHWRVLALLSTIPLALLVIFRKQITELAASVSQNEQLVTAGYDPALPFFSYLRTYITALVSHVYAKFIWPAGLNIDPDIRPVENWYSPEFLLSLCVIAGLAAAVLLLKRKNQVLLRVGLLGILISPLAAYAVMPLADVVQEHRIYIAGMGLAAAVAWFAQWTDRKHSRAAVIVVSAAVLVLGITTINRNPVWASNLTLWRDAVEKSPAKARAHVNLGQAYQLGGHAAEAVQEYQAALRLRPGLPHANLNLGLLYLQQGDAASLNSARQIFERMRQTSPSFVDGWSHLGTVYNRLGQPDRALEVLNQALSIRPNADSSLFARGDSYALKGQYKEAISDYKAAVALRPDVGFFHLRLGATYIRAGDTAGAEQEFMKLAEDPNLGADANHNLGILRMDAGDNDGAQAFFQAALAQRPNYPEVHHDLGQVLLRKGMPDRAIEEFRSALGQKPDFALAIASLSQAYEKVGKLAEARQVLDEDFQKFPAHNSPYLRQIRDRLQ
jgi:protein O-mannosyl-transferase